MACQRLTINVTSQCLFCQGNRYRYFCGPTILWEELVRDFGGKDETKSLKIFSKPSIINGFGMSLPTTI